MGIPFRIALEKAVGIAIGLMAIEFLGRMAFNRTPPPMAVLRGGWGADDIVV